MPTLTLPDASALSSATPLTVWAMSLGSAAIPPGAAVYSTIVAALLMVAAALGRLHPLAGIGRHQHRSEAVLSLAAVFLATWMFAGIMASVQHSDGFVSLDCYSFDGSPYPGC
jgi:hypothetical protein